MSSGTDPRRDTPLAKRLRDDIQRHGPMPVEVYMARCLWDPEHGYYSSQQVFGRQGDFITASEISQVFGELIGLWTAVVWQETLARPNDLALCEYGPGRGTLMFDALRATRVVGGFHDAVSVHMVEMSERLSQVQGATLAGLDLPVSWSKNLVPASGPTIVIANEFIDAWPVTQWVRHERGWLKRCVGLDANQQLTFVISPAIEMQASAEIRAQLDASHGDAGPNTIVERHDLGQLAAAMRAIARAGPLAAVLIDYGHTTPASGDTLQAVRQHHYEDPLCSPGEADLSAQVNFYDLALALHHHGLALDGPVTQTEFLGALGAVERTSRLMAANPDRAGEIETGVARIMAPNGMGTRFKVLGVRSPHLEPLPGFAASS